MSGLDYSLIALLGLGVILALRSMYRQKKRGGGCCGCCESCGGHCSSRRS